MGTAVAKRRRRKMHWRVLWRCWSYCHHYIWAGGTHELHTLWVLLPQSGQISWHDSGTGGIQLAMIFQSVPHWVKGLMDHEKSMVRVLKNNSLYPALHYEQPNGGCLLYRMCTWSTGPSMSLTHENGRMGHMSFGFNMHGITTVIFYAPSSNIFMCHITVGRTRSVLSAVVFH